MRVVTCIDQLRVHSHVIGCPLHAAFEQVGHAKLLSDFAQVALRAGLILHHAGAADHFQLSDFCEIRQNFILHAVGEESVLFFVAHVFKRQNRNALFRNGSWCW